jgi:septal ring factor EnvC (AmiA/AmiB activator)
MPLSFHARGCLAVLLAAVLTVLGLVVSAPEPTWALPSEGKLAEAKARASELDRMVARAEADLRDVRKRLDALEIELAVATEELEVAEAIYRIADAAAEEASRQARAAEDELREAEAELAANRVALGDLARDTYKYGRGAAAPALAMFESLSEAGGAESFSDRLHYLQRTMDERGVSVERAGVLAIQVEQLTLRAQAEEAAMQRALREAEDARVVAAKAHARVEKLTAETSVQLEKSAQLVAALEGEKQEVAAKVVALTEQVARERAEQERLERERRERIARERAARERAEREKAEQQRRARSSSSGGSSGSSGGGSSGGRVSVSPGPSGNLRTVQGITVAASLAPQLEALLNAARADGIVLGGSGYRSPEITARLRAVNGCPDIYNSPASSCRVPTARPGSSEHEKGLAVDFTYRGQTICFPSPGSRCHGNPAFDWLRANAGRFGLYNLSSEAWHWSTTGR